MIDRVAAALPAGGATHKHTHTHTQREFAFSQSTTKQQKRTHTATKQDRERANFKASVLETAKNCRNSTNSCTAAAPKQSLKVAKLYPVAPPGDVHNKNAHLNVNDFNGRTRKNLEPVLFITLTLSKEKAKSRECRECGAEGKRSRRRPTGLACCASCGCGCCALPCLFLLRL